MSLSTITTPICLTRVYRWKTFTRLLINCFSLTWYSYKAGVLEILVDRASRINNTWFGSHEDITKLIDILKKESFSCPVIGI